MSGWRWREGFPGGLGRVSKSLRENMTFTKSRQKIILIPLNKVISEQVNRDNEATENPDRKAKPVVVDNGKGGTRTDFK